jgi:hypothetical protein
MTCGDRYEVVKALGPWILVWFENVERIIKLSEKLGSVLLTAHL